VRYGDVEACRDTLQDDNGGEVNMTPIRIRVVALALSIAFGSVGGAGSTQRSAEEQNVPGTIPCYNFGQNGRALHRQPHGEKQMAISVRCVRE
jgi:hypothetical protein